MFSLKRIVLFVLVAFVGLVAFSGMAVADNVPKTTLSANKTATGHMKREFTWTIDKSVAPASWDLFVGDSGTSKYTISVTKDDGADTYYVSGVIDVTNGGSYATENLAIVDEVQYKVGAGQYQTLTSAPVDLDGYTVLEAGGSHSYPYQVNFTPVEGVTYRNVAHVTITNHAGHLPGDQNCSGPELCPFGPDPKADFSLPGSPDILIKNRINVDDTNGGSWPFSASGSASYDKIFSCEQTGKNTYDNTATIRETGQSDSASVTVNCYKLTCSTTIDPSYPTYNRTYNWTIDKSADQSALILSTGQVSIPVNYSVLLAATSADSDWKVSGLILVTNPAPINAMLNDISDIISPDIAAAVNCGGGFPIMLGKGDTLQCSYSADLPDSSSRTNTVTVTQQNYAYDSSGGWTLNGTTDISGSADIVFGDPILIDECVGVSDTYEGGPNGVVVCNNAVPTTLTYSRLIGPYLVCGDYTVDNSAAFIASDTGASGSDTWSVKVSVPCAGGCTLTQGYWKTHSKYGKAPYDDTWAQIGEDTIFYLSGKSWYQVFWTPPQGNAYYILAHQYMAAKLNQLNGADVSAVSGVLSQAQSLLATITPTTKPSKTVAAQLTQLASKLDQYNSGLIGPGHCSE